MIPEFDLRLDSMLRAMTTVVLPAIDPGNNLAREQASLVTAHIAMMMQQWDKLDAYARLCLDDLGRVVESLEVRGGSLTRGAAADLEALNSSESPPNNQSYRKTMAALENLVRAVEVDGDPGFRRQLHRDVLLFGNRQAERDRAWFAMSGFDVNAKDRPTIEELLSR